jgi:micrococcal nuclease
MSLSRVILLVVLLVCAVLAARLATHRDRPDPARAGAAATVTRVVDGDTVHVDLDGTDETVRYIGIDTPESVKPGTPVQCYAEQASAANARLVRGQDVRLRFDAERRDRFGRLLAYVYRADDGTLVNARLVRDGAARPLRIAPNTRFAARFSALAAEAKAAGRGLWKAC